MERGKSGSAAGMPAVLAGVALLAGVAVLAGCAASSARTVPNVRHTHTTTPTPTPRALPHASCGAAVTHGLSAATQILSADKGTLNCFHVAARDCKTASIAVTVMGVDTGTNHVFAIEPGGKGCAVTELSQSYSANFGGSHGKIGSTPCSVTGISGGGVTLACAGEKVLIPAAVTRL